MNFDIIYHAVGSVFTLFLIGAVGYALACKGWFTPESRALLPRLVTMVALPAFMLHNITSSFDRDELFHLVYGALIPFASIALCFGMSILISRLIKTPPPRKGIFQVGFTASNTIFIGLPVNLALFGEGTLPYVLLYYFANTSFFWTVGNYALAADGGRKAKVLSLSSLKQIVSPPMLGFMLGLTLLALNLKLPFFLADAARYLGNLTTPLIILFLGVMLQGIRFNSMRLDKELLFLLLGRFVVSPLTVLALTLLFPLPEMMRNVFIIQASLPAVASLSLLAGYYKSDPEFATLAVGASTLLSIITIPLYMTLLSH